MLYPKNRSERLDPELFKNPTSEYRAAPFWAWNAELLPELLEKEIDYMKGMGFGGYHIHPRVGLATPYLSEEFMTLVRTCLEKGKENEMLTWLYDEDKWPSGFAGGLNTKDLESREKTLHITPIPYDDGTLITEADQKAATTILPKSKYQLLACFDILLNEEYRLISYQRIELADEVSLGHDKWFCYMEYAVPMPYFNNQTYCDTLQKAVIENFIRITHEAYKKEFAAEFGKHIPAIFSDEPQVARKGNLPHASDKKSVRFPYTTDLEETFQAEYGVSLLDNLPVLVFEPENGIPSPIRYHYHDHLGRRFTEAYADTIGKWCEENGILFTGHMIAEHSLERQTSTVGDVMRPYRSFTLPGVDVLEDNRELNTVKQAQSISHQYGREGVLSELYGVTNWDFDFRGHKLQGDWQAALGVTVRVPHLTWFSMKGEAKRDYPASIGYQSPWYREYKRIEDHFARVSTVMTRGKPNVKIGVIHPVESYWLHFGPINQTSSIGADMQTRMNELTRWLIHGFRDFDFICESLLPEQYHESERGFSVGKMCYDTVILPALETIRKTTLDALKTFRKKGGKVIVMGKAPRYMDALVSDEPNAFCRECQHITWSRHELYEMLADEVFLEIKDEAGKAASGLASNLRDDGDIKHLFISHVDKPRSYDDAPLTRYMIAIKGEWTVHEYETINGIKRRMQVSYQNGKTMLPWVCGANSSLLLELSPDRDTEKSGFVYRTKRYITSEYPAYEANYELSEPNVVLFDRVEHRIADGEWQKADNVLKVDALLRDTLGYRRRGGGMAQPWLEPLNKDPKDHISLRFRFRSEIEYEGAKLALEYPEYSTVSMNGENVPVVVDGYYIDEDGIKTIALPRIKKGENVITVELRFGDITQIEAYYLLGNFGVEHHGMLSTVTALPEKIYFDDLSRQKFPFYGANIKYSFQIMGGSNKTVEVSHYRGAVIKVYVDGKQKGYIDFPPYRCELGYLSDGEHTVTLEFFGTRINTLGQLHNVQRAPLIWPGGNSWHTKEQLWTDDYLFFPQGILSSPRILTEE